LDTKPAGRGHQRRKWRNADWIRCRRYRPQHFNLQAGSPKCRSQTLHKSHSASVQGSQECQIRLAASDKANRSRQPANRCAQARALHNSERPRHVEAYRPSWVLGTASRQMSHRDRDRRRNHVRISLAGAGVRQRCPATCNDVRRRRLRGRGSRSEAKTKQISTAHGISERFLLTVRPISYIMLTKK
jgi:hypothetical protein